MRPSVDLQLSQAQRILTEAVLPAVPDPTAADTLRRVIADLRKLSTCWESAIPFTQADVASLEALLAGLNVPLPAACDELGTSSYASLLLRQESLRATLEQAITDASGGFDAASTQDAVISYFRSRLATDPMTNRTPASVGIDR